MAFFTKEEDKGGASGSGDQVLSSSVEGNPLSHCAGRLVVKGPCFISLVNPAFLLNFFFFFFFFFFVTLSLVYEKGGKMLAVSLFGSTPTHTHTHTHTRLVFLFCFSRSVYYFIKSLQV
jgi:hypothetical protein